MTQAILNWLNGSDKGASSKAIAMTAMGAMPPRPEHPRDPSDFGRCHRLLQSVPEARAGLDDLAKRGGRYWAALGARWGDIVESYDAEVGQKAMPNTNTLIRGILAPLEAADRSHIQLSPGVSMRFGS